MRVLHLVTHRSPFFDRRIERLRERGHTCEVVTVPGRDQRDRAERKAARRSLGHYVRFHGRVLGAARRSFDLVHAHYGLTSPFALGQPHRPVVLTLWGSDLLGEFGWLSERCARLVAETVVMNEAMAARLDGDATVVPHGVDLDLFRPMDRRRARRAVGWDADRAHVLFPYAPDRDVKNHTLAERVCERVQARVDRDVSLHAVYEVDLPAMPVYMNAADALLVTSRREGSPNTVKEAMACGLPVVATDVGDVRDRLDGVSPSTVGTDAADLVAGLAAVLERGERSDGRAAVRPLDTHRMAERIETIYRRALAA
jgi:glycosyltransferase involved in cell wall biosynthesis